MLRQRGRWKPAWDGEDKAALRPCGGRPRQRRSAQRRLQGLLWSLQGLPRRGARRVAALRLMQGARRRAAGGAVSARPARELVAAHWQCRTCICTVMQFMQRTGARDGLPGRKTRSVLNGSHRRRPARSVVIGGRSFRRGRAAGPAPADPPSPRTVRATRIREPRPAGPLGAPGAGPGPVRAWGRWYRRPKQSRPADAEAVAPRQTPRPQQWQKMSDSDPRLGRRRLVA
jgi:hypothetical protein